MFPQKTWDICQNGYLGDYKANIMAGRALFGVLQIQNTEAMFTGKTYDRQTKHRGARAKKRIEPKHRVNAISLPDSQSVLPKNVGAGLLQPQLHLACAEIGHNRSGQAGIQVRQKAIVRVIVRAVVTFRPIVRTS